MASKADIAAVSTVVRDRGRFLLVQRGRAPAKGLFAFPGGRVGPGEDDEEAARRELHEETGLTAGALALRCELTLDGDDDSRYRLRVYRALQAEGELVAGDDAQHAGWYSLEEMRHLPVTDSTLAIAEDLAKADGA